MATVVYGKRCHKRIYRDQTSLIIQRYSQLIVRSSITIQKICLRQASIWMYGQAWTITRMYYPELTFLHCRIIFRIYSKQDLHHWSTPVTVSFNYLNSEITSTTSYLPAILNNYCFYQITANKITHKQKHKLTHAFLNGAHTWQTHNNKLKICLCLARICLLVLHYCTHKFKHWSTSPS